MIEFDTMPAPPATELPSNVLDFSYNWNGKLNCKCFTTLRVSGRHQIGDRLQIVCSKIEPFVVEVIDKKQLSMGALNEWIAHIDTGYTLEETKNILRRMYSKKMPNIETAPLYLYLLKRL